MSVSRKIISRKERRRETQRTQRENIIMQIGMKFCAFCELGGKNINRKGTKYAKRNLRFFKHDKILRSLRQFFAPSA